MVATGEVMADTTFGDLPWGVFGIVLIAALAISTGLIVVLRPYMLRYALARPNARSSHREPTPQGGGIAVVAATLAGIWLGIALLPFDSAARWQFLVLTTASLLLAIVGAIDDIRGLGALPRLLIQALAVGIVVRALPLDFSTVPQLPVWLERVLLLLGG